MSIASGLLISSQCTHRGVIIAYQRTLAEAWGKHVKSGMPFFWSEKEMDHDDKLELLVGAINGRSKIRFEVDHGDAKQFTDYGVMCIDTAVKLQS